MDAEFQKQGLTDLTETDLQAVVTPGRHSGYCRHWRGYCMFCEKTRGLLPLSSFIRRRYFLSFENTAGPYRIHNTPDKRNATSPYSLAINKSGRVWPGISPRTGKEAQKTEVKGSRYALESQQVIIEKLYELPCRSAGYPHIQSLDPVIRSLQRSLLDQKKIPTLLKAASVLGLEDDHLNCSMLIISCNW